MRRFINLRTGGAAVCLLVSAGAASAAIVYQEKLAAAEQALEAALSPSLQFESPFFAPPSFFTIGPAQKLGTIYYVDPATGNNANSGTSPDAPWVNPPGTRTVDNKGFYSSAWGAVTMRSKVACGDVVLLKGGSVQTKAQGGSWRIDNGLYENGSGFYTTNCPANAPITLRVASSSEWPGSQGSFTLDGSGVVATCLFACDDTHALVHVQDIDTFILGGRGENQRLVIRNAGRGGLRAHNLMLTSSRPPPNATVRFIGQWLELANASGDGVGVGPAEQFIIRESISHDNTRSGFSTGNLNDNRVVHGAFEDIEAYGNGPRSGSLGDQFLFLGCESCYLIRAKSHDGYLRGLNFGNIGGFGGTDMFLLIRDSEFWNNGLSTDNQSVCQSGPCWSGNDAPAGQVQWGVMEQSIMHRNREGGGPCAYGQGWAEVWNSVWWGNGWDKSTGGQGDITIAGQGDVKYLGVFNSIVQKRSYNISWTASGPFNFIASRCPVSNFNLYQPVSSNDETFSDFQCGRPNLFHKSKRTYANPPSFIGTNDRIGTAYRAGFRAPSDTEYSKTGFQLNDASSAIDAGTFMMRTNGSGYGRTLPVLGNGASNDPRHYFISPESYYQASGDTIQIDGASCETTAGQLGSAERARIISMTDTAITLDRACTWFGSAGIHFQWNGTRPDMGVSEF